MARNVVITGAGSGLGRALAKHYAARGDVVCCADIQPARAEETVAMLPGAGHFAATVDVGDDAAFRALREAVEARMGRVDILYNNAGVASGGSLLDAGMDEWRWMLEINLLGVVRGCREFLPGMLRAGQGTIVNIASFAALAGAPHIMSYGVAKAGVYTLSEQLAAECDGTGVRVSVACPSFFRTNLAESYRGSERMRIAATRLVANSPYDADEIARRLATELDRGRFLLLPTSAERWRWRIKRWAPALYRYLLRQAIHQQKAPH